MLKVSPLEVLPTIVGAGVCPGLSSAGVMLALDSISISICPSIVGSGLLSGVVLTTRWNLIYDIYESGNSGFSGFLGVMILTRA